MLISRASSPHTTPANTVPTTTPTMIPTMPATGPNRRAREPDRVRHAIDTHLARPPSAAAFGQLCAVATVGRLRGGVGGQGIPRVGRGSVGGRGVGCGGDDFRGGGLVGRGAARLVRLGRPPAQRPQGLWWLSCSGWQRRQFHWAWVRLSCRVRRSTVQRVTIAPWVGAGHPARCPRRVSRRCRP